MKRTPDVERVLLDYLADDGLTAPDHVLDVVVDRISRLRQRRSWRTPWRDPMSTSTKLAAGVAAVALVSIAVWQLLPGLTGLGSVKPSPSPSPTAAATSDAGLPLTQGPLAPGRYVTEVAGVEIEFVLPPEARGWEGGDAAFLGVPPMVDPPAGVFLGFNSVTHVTQDPCRTHLIPKSVGASVDDIAAVWAALPHAQIVGPTDINVSGFDGARVELTVDEGVAECEIEAISLYNTGSAVRVVGAGHKVELWAIDVAGSRLVVEASYLPDARPADVAILQQIVDSIELASSN